MITGAMEEAMVVATKEDGTIPILGITTKEVVGVATRVVAVAAVTEAVVMAAGVGGTKTLATTANRHTVVDPLGTNNMVATTAPLPTT